jgi:hypothetical protein
MVTSRSRRRPLTRATVVAIAVLVLAELLLRLPAVADALGKPDLYYWAGVRERLDAIAETESEHGDIDVLFIGSSVVRTNIRPLEFDRVLADRGIDTVSFNGGLSGLRIDAVRLYVEEFWLDVLSPEVIFQAVRYEEVLRPEPAEEYVRFEQGRYEPLWLSESPVAPVQRFALDKLRLAQYAGLLTDALASPDTAFEDETGFPIDARGWNATAHRLLDVRASTDDDDIPGGDAVRNGYTDVLDPTAFDEGLSMLAETIAAVRASGAMYVLVNMPEHGDKFLNAADGQDRYRLYVDTLRSFAAAQGVPFIDVTNGDANVYQTDEPFSDFHHMSPDGAAELTRLIAEAAMVGEILPFD